jgi:hypothetical protein
MSFTGHHSTLPPLAYKKLSVDLIDNTEAAKEPLRVAGGRLGRTVGTDSRIVSLLSRNYYQIKDVEAVYAVGDFDKGGWIRKDSVGVDGGTGWTCQMFFDRFFDEFTSSPDTRRFIPLYFFSQAQGAWFQCELRDSIVDFEKQIHGCVPQWHKIEAPPKPSGNYAGIGTRQLKCNGKEAIHSLFV